MSVNHRPVFARFVVGRDAGGTDLVRIARRIQRQPVGMVRSPRAARVDHVADGGIAVSGRCGNRPFVRLDEGVDGARPGVVEESAVVVDRRVPAALAAIAETEPLRDADEGISTRRMHPVATGVEGLPGANSTVQARPPMRCDASRSTNDTPRDAADLAAERPAAPAPTMTTSTREAMRHSWVVPGGVSMPITLPGPGFHRNGRGRALRCRSCNAVRPHPQRRHVRPGGRSNSLGVRRVIVACSIEESHGDAALCAVSASPRTATVRRDCPGLEDR